MKKMRKIIPALAMLLMSAVLMSTASFAWFSMNTQVTVSGMQVKAKAAGGSLIINEQYDLLLSESKSSIEFNEEAKALSPTTFETDAWKYAEGKKVDTATGKMKIDPTTNQPYALTAVTEANAASYYLDKVFYIASAGGELSGQKLKASVNITTTAEEADKMALNATSVAVALLKNASGEIKFTETGAKGTVTTAPALNVSFVGQTTANEGFISGESEIVIPTMSADATENGAGALAVLVRIYFDGNLSTDDQDTKKYVRDANYLADNMSVEVVFDVEGTTPAPEPQPEGT